VTAIYKRSDRHADFAVMISSAGASCFLEAAESFDKRQPAWTWRQ